MTHGTMNRLSFALAQGDRFPAQPSSRIFAISASRLSAGISTMRPISSPPRIKMKVGTYSTPHFSVSPAASFFVRSRAVIQPALRDARLFNQLEKAWTSRLLSPHQVPRNSRTLRHPRSRIVPPAASGCSQRRSSSTRPRTALSPCDLPGQRLRRGVSGTAVCAWARSPRKPEPITISINGSTESVGFP